MSEAIFIELSLIIIVTMLMAGLAKTLRQPMIIAYIGAGLVLSPYGLNIVKAHDAIGTFSQLGIALLLFMVGLNLNPNTIKTVGRISLTTGLGQILFTSVIGFGLASLFKFSLIEAAYIAIALAFSSTIVIMKILSDKKDLDTLYGRISIGFLIVQDIVAMLILIFLSSLSYDEHIVSAILQSVLKGAGSIAVIMLIGHYLLPKILKKIADSPEFLMLFCIAWCFALASAFHYIGLSIEIGALLAGVSLSISHYRYEISSRIRPLRDFFLLMFFVFLGSQMQFGNFHHYLLPSLAFSALVLIGNPIIVMSLMGAARYTKRTGFLAGLTVAQISEFSLIIVAMGIKLGHIRPEILSLLTVTALTTIGGSTYLIIYGKKIYKKLNRYLAFFERKGKKKDEHQSGQGEEYDCVLLGYNHIGLNLSKTLKKMNKTFMVVDYNPDVINELVKDNTPCLYSDIEDGDVFEKVNLKKTKLIVSTVKTPDINLPIIRQIRDINKDCIIIVTSEGIEEAMQFYEAGATYVIMPHQLGGHHASTLIENYGLDIKQFIPDQLKHMEQLKLI